MSGVRLGIDVGGTFTDFTLIDEKTGATQLLKVPSTPGDPSTAVVEGWRRLVDDPDVSPEDVRRVTHGTTVGTNALLEQRGARVGLLTTKGFREILHLARGQTPPPFGMWISMVKPDPLASLEDTREVSARIGADGVEIAPVDDAEVRGQIAELVEAGIESLTVSLLNSYVDPAHEHRIRELAEAVAPDLPISLSSDVLREFREYERTLTTVVNSYLKPRMKGYLSRLGDGLSEARLGAPVNVVRSDGGLMSLQSAIERPVATIVSGPAGGVRGAIEVARRAGFDNFLTFDMGGTSTDVSLVRDGKPMIDRDLTVGPFAVRTPSLMIHTVGAGGGSIAYVPELTGALRVGPRSAGADPGPAAYGRGGSEATVTDANLVLGYLPTSLLDGEFELDLEAARAAVGAVGEAMGLGIEEAAQGILDIANESMYSALRVVSIQRGQDPREFALFAFGGAGPLHANALGRLLGSWPVIIPPSPGVLCAQGHVSTDVRHEIGQTFIRRFDRVASAEVADRLEDLGSEASRWLTSEAIAPDDQRVDYELGVRYFQQGAEVAVQITRDELSNVLDAVAERFGAMHEELFGFRLDAVCEIVNLRAIGSGLSAPLEVPGRELGEEDPADALSDTQPAFIDGGWVDTPHYQRSRLRPGNRVNGPAVITQLDSTVLVLPGHDATVDPYQNILIQPNDGRTP